MLRGWLLALLLLAHPAFADTLRVATYNTELSRKGPGLLLRDILKGNDPQVLAALQDLAQTQADIVAVQNLDHDLDGTALAAFAEALGALGQPYPYQFSGPPNAGVATGLDLDGDGRLGGPGDAQGFGTFFGQGSMAILSRYPIVTDDVQDFSGLLWRELPGALLPQGSNGPYPSNAAQAIQRLSSTGHWVVPVDVPEVGIVHLLVFHATPPVFDGPEDRNGRRNHDEVLFWDHYLSGEFGPPPVGRFILLGDANLDPDRGDGIRSAMRRLLDNPNLQDPLPGRITAIWPAPGPGEMRVDYVLPSADWTVIGAGIGAGLSASAKADGSRHRPVWADLEP